MRVLGLPQYEEQLILSGNYLRMIAGVWSRPRPYAVAAAAAAWSRGEGEIPGSASSFLSVEHRDVTVRTRGCVCPSRWRAGARLPGASVERDR